MPFSVQRTGQINRQFTVHGHLVGDQVLTMLAPRMRSAVRRGDLVGRLSGDEFVVIADQLEPAQARQLARRIRAAVAVPITYKGAAMAVTVSVGICPIPVDGADPTTILRDADPCELVFSKQPSSSCDVSHLGVQLLFRGMVVEACPSATDTDAAGQHARPLHQYPAMPAVDTSASRSPIRIRSSSARYAVRSRRARRGSVGSSGSCLCGPPCCGP